MNRMTLEQANEHFALKHKAELKLERLGEARNNAEVAELDFLDAKAALCKFEFDLEAEGIDPNEA